MQAWNTIDKSEWLERGEWDQEPDKLQWIDKLTGLDCLIVRGSSHGCLCGYVGVPDTHPLYGKHCDEAPNFDVHGGLTFSNRCSPSNDPSRGVCHTGNVANKDVWWLGFDCAHAGDYCPGFSNFLSECRPMDYEKYRNLNYVINQVESLASQIMA